MIYSKIWIFFMIFYAIVCMTNFYQLSTSKKRRKRKKGSLEVSIWCVMLLKDVSNFVNSSNKNEPCRKNDAKITM